MSQVSPPKPWERAGTIATPSTAMTTTLPAGAATSSSAPGAPAIPARPAALANIARTGLPGITGASNAYGSPYSQSRYGNTGMGSYGSYGSGMGGYSSYSSPYSRLGGMGGYGMGGGYGGMGGYGMGGMGGGMYGGMGGMGGGMGDPNDPNSLTNGMQNSTAATFQMIESIVGAFGSFAQMLESTFMATHSSFFAMVSVAEQFGNLRTTLGQILGIFTIIRWVKTGIAKLTGRPLPASASDLTADAFANFGSSRPGSPAKLPRGPSKKPFVIFLLAVFGLPYLMGKLIRALASKQEEEEKARTAAMNAAAGGQPLDLADPMKKLDFCRVLYDFTPENPAIELEAKKGDLIAVLSKSDPLGNPSQWWKCRTRDSRVGYLPEPYLEAVVRNGQVINGKMIEGAPGSRAQSLTAASLKAASAASEAGRSMSLGSTPTTKAGDISIESFQKSGFNY